MHHKNHSPGIPRASFCNLSSEPPCDLPLWRLQSYSRTQGTQPHSSSQEPEKLPLETKDSAHHSSCLKRNSGRAHTHEKHASYSPGNTLAVLFLLSTALCVSIGIKFENTPAQTMARECAFGQTRCSRAP